jgi:hypothetical protein
MALIVDLENRGLKVTYRLSKLVHLIRNKMCPAKTAKSYNCLFIPHLQCWKLYRLGHK